MVIILQIGNVFMRSIHHNKKVCKKCLLGSLNLLILINFFLKIKLYLL